MTKLVQGVNDLATTHPHIAREWHPNKNGELSPQMVTAGSGKKVWWYLPYDDVITGKHFDFEWEATINSRVNQNQGCPFLSGCQVWVGYNDLETTNPKISAEWHPVKNGTLTPKDVSAGSEKKVWWLLPYDDPNTGKHFDFEWETQIYCRVQGRGCPYLSGNDVWGGFNDLETTHPNIAKEWHPTKNGALTPRDITAGSGKKVWWYLSYDDIKTGKHFDFEWQAKPNTRTSQSIGCPYLSGKAVWSGYNDLATTNLELAKEWNTKKNGKLTPQMVNAGSRKKVWWKCKDCDNEWVSTICGRTNGTGCPRCAKKHHTSFPEQAIYYYVKKYYPDAINSDNHIGMELDIYIPSLQIAIEYDGEKWHHTQEQVERDNRKNMLCKINNITLIRIRESKLETMEGCICLQRKSAATNQSLNDVIKDIFELVGNTNTDIDVDRDTSFIVEQFSSKEHEKSLEYRFPEIAKEWHPTKNGSLTPDKVPHGSHRKAWWLLPYDDPVTGRHFDFEWQATVNNRTSNDSKCPYLSGKAVWSGYNDLATIFSEVASEWHPTKNGMIKPQMVTKNSQKKVWWQCKECGYEYERKVGNQVRYNGSCPRCKKKS